MVPYIRLRVRVLVQYEYSYPGLDILAGTCILLWIPYGNVVEFSFHSFFVRFRFTQYWVANQYEYGTFTRFYPLLLLVLVSYHRMSAIAQCTSTITVFLPVIRDSRMKYSNPANPATVLHILKVAVLVQVLVRPASSTRTSTRTSMP